MIKKKIRKINLINKQHDVIYGGYLTYDSPTPTLGFDTFDGTVNTFTITPMLTTPNTFAFSEEFKFALKTMITEIIVENNLLSHD